LVALRWDVAERGATSPGVVEAFDVPEDPHLGVLSGVRPRPAATSYEASADNQIVEHWTNFDRLGMLQQLGAIGGAK
jgi:hypothetical protein